MKEERTIIIKENENAEEVEAYEEKIIKLLSITILCSSDHFLINLICASMDSPRCISDEYLVYTTA